MKDQNIHQTEKKTVVPKLEPKGYIIQYKEEPLIKKYNEYSASEFSEYQSNLNLRRANYKRDIGNKLIAMNPIQRNYAGSATAPLVAEREVDVRLMNEFQNSIVGIVLDINEEEAAEIAKLPFVKSVEKTKIVRPLLYQAVPLVGAVDLWEINDAAGNPITGQGMSIAVLDTGVDYLHEDLGGCLGAGCKVIAGWDFHYNDPDPMDGHGHGTHCAATAGGSGDHDGDGTVEAGEGLHGVAPNAIIYAYRVLGPNGGYDFNIIDAIERSMDPNQDGNPSDHVDVITMSIGGRGSNPHDSMSNSVNSAMDADIVVLVAAGNSGPSGENECNQYADKSTFSTCSPGIAQKIITVGSSTNPGDSMSGFSSRGPVYDQIEDIYFPKPDILAPGQSLCAAKWSGSSSSTCYDTKHRSMMGTSMATPMAAGAAALIRQAHPGWSSQDVKSAMMQSGLDIGASIHAQGGGRIQLMDIYETTFLIYPASEQIMLSDYDTTKDYEKSFLLKNTGSSSISVDISIASDFAGFISLVDGGVVVDSKTVAIPASGQTTVSLTFRTNNAGIPEQSYNGADILFSDTTNSKEYHAQLLFAQPQKDGVPDDKFYVHVTAQAGWVTIIQYAEPSSGLTTEIIEEELIINAADEEHVYEIDKLTSSYTVIALIASDEKPNANNLIVLKNLNPIAKMALVMEQTHQRQIYTI